MRPENFVFRLTGPGVAALATVRLVGPLVPAFLNKHFSKRPQPGRLVHGELRDESGVIDDPVGALAADSSYADITLHGGVWITQAVFDCANRAGFSCYTGTIDPQTLLPESADLVDAETQLALPLVRTELAARTLIAQREAWRAMLDEGKRVDYDAALADDSLHHLLHPPTVAIIGLPNAGKSTLANRLFGSDRSIVSPIAGTTRDWVGEEANLNGLIVRLLDTPGRHETDDIIERQAIEQSRAPVASASLVIVLFDASRAISQQLHLLEGVDHTLPVLNKVDIELRDALGVNAEAEKIVSPLNQALRVRASTGEGVEMLIEAIHRRFGIGARPLTAARWWTPRQRELLKSRGNSAEP